jgi:transcriptional antiterminator RfaH
MSSQRSLTPNDSPNTLFDAAVRAQWFAIQVLRRKEQVVADMLSMKGYESFLPIVKLHARSNNHTPLFPGYLFCRLRLVDRSVPVVTTPGVIRILGASGKAVPIPDEDIHALMKIVESGFPVEARRGLEAGDPIEISEGCMCGVRGKVVRCKSEWRFVVELPLLQRCVLVEIDMSQLRPLSQTRRDVDVQPT